MKKSAKMLIAALCVTVGAGALIACDGGGSGGEKNDNKVTVTFYDATGTNAPSEMTVVKTVKIDKNTKLTVGADGKVGDYTPVKDGGYEFVDWFATPNKTHRFDFSENIDKDVAVYGGFSKYVADTRDFYVIGAGKSNVLIDGWEVVKNEAKWESVKDNHKFTKTENKNEYKMKLDLMEGDKFVIASNESYHYKHGAGYIVSTVLDDKTVFEGEGSVYDSTFWGANIVVKYSGSYTITLNTHPNEDWFDENGNNYTEETKEVYARNPYDTIEWVRNGDVENELTVITDFYIKGANITNWHDMYNPATKMTEVDGVYSLSVYLKKGEEFLFSSTNTVGDTVGAGAEYLRSTNLDDASKAYLDETAGKNMVAKESGMYTFSYDSKTTQKLTVTFDGEATVAEADYYIDGTFADGVKDWEGYCFNADYKLTETAAGSGIYEIKGVEMKADSQIIIQAFKKGSTERGEWNTPGYNGLGSYNYFYLDGGGEKFSAVGGGNNNIKVLAAGTYDITFNSYSKIMTIVEHIESADTLDIYIKGENINGWAHGWSEDYLFKLSADEKAYEFTLTVEDGKTVTFGLEKHPKGEKTGYGDYINSSALGTDGDANADFTPEKPGNLTCSKAGTYKLVYTIATGKLDIYAVKA